jgi:hypothetical protein
MNWKYTSLLIIIAVMAGYILFTKQCDKCPPEQFTIQTDTIPGDSITYEVVRYKPVPIEKIIHDTTWKTQKIDTAAILQAYFDKVCYKDTIRKDSSFIAIINDTISQNRIINRRFWLQNLRITKIETTITPPPDKWFFGPQASYFNQKAGVGVSVLYIKNKKAYSVSFDVLNKGFTIDYYFKF